MTATLDDAEALRTLVHQTERAGTQRRALLLHTDRLPPALGRPHHHRLARAAIAGLAQADRAQSFELTRGRIAIVWRHSGAGRELTEALAALDHLMADLPEDQLLPPGRLISLFDLPTQGPWLLDELVENQGHARHTGDQAMPIDLALLTQLETALARADVSRFARRRPVMQLGDGGRTLAWEERSLSVPDVTVALCPDRRLTAEPWLFRRLTRSFDRRLLTLLANPQELRGSPPFALNLNIASLVSAEFLRFDAALPGALRGEVVLQLDVADVLSDPALFLFAREFVRARAYRLLLRAATPALLGLFDIAAARIEYAMLPWSPAVEADATWLRRVPDGVAVVLSGVDTYTAAEWARHHEVRFIPRPSSPGVTSPRVQMCKSLLLLFFRKEGLPSFLQAARPISAGMPRTV